ncbi:MAG TPA: hypothetical protein VKA18_12615, partial [Alphaproteobacteria bacterium]|nr:hypothetical protein [Alphaproteobacteria bacterium]
QALRNALGVTIGRGIRDQYTCHLSLGLMSFPTGSGCVASEVQALPTPFLVSGHKFTFLSLDLQHPDCDTNGAPATHCQAAAFS